MLLFWTLVVGAVLGYVYGFYLKPNKLLRKSIEEAKQTCQLALQEGRKGVYRTLVQDHDQSSELVVEVKELALTQASQVKVEYLSAFYKNPSFRTKKEEALLREVRDLLGDYLPEQDIEWYDNRPRQTNIQEQLNNLNKLHEQHFGA